MALSAKEILAYNVSAPRYTSYPPANYFKASNEFLRVEELIQASNDSETDNVSFYFHIPFCPIQCLYCGCQMEIGVKKDAKERYFDNLFEEMDRTLPLINKNRPVSQIHFGGGTPNAVPYHYLKQILDKIRERFELSESTEIAIECDPSLLIKKRVTELCEMGFNRISLGIQDIHQKVLDSVERKNTIVPLEELVPFCREQGMKSVNLDLIYGLPYQSRESFRETINKILQIAPDRLATFAYAHVPWVKEQQNKMPVDELPDAEERVEIHCQTVEMMTQAGYEWVGMDHFALPSDSLGRALNEGTLKRNFQGYCTKEHTGQVYGFGASSISQLDSCFYQNAKESLDYSNKMESKEGVIVKLYELSKEEKYISKIIEELMCNGVVDFSQSWTHSGLDVRKLAVESRFSTQLEMLKKEDLIDLQENVLKLTEKGKWVPRYVAMHLDPLLQEKTETKKFSQSL